MAGISTPSDFDAHTLAEYVEAALLIENQERISGTELLQKFPLGQRPSANNIEDAAALILERAVGYEVHYPYSIDEDGAVVRGGRRNLYDFLLLLSLELTPFRRASDFQRSDPLFDDVVAAAVKGYLGENGRSLTFGWPPRGDRPAGFIEAVTWVGSRLGLEDSNRDRPVDYKDAGVDVIAWKPFRDARSNFTTYLVQDTVKSAFATKPKDVVPGQWMEWLKFGTPPKVGFAVPFSLAQTDRRWAEINYYSDVFFDRFRLLEWTTFTDELLSVKLGEFVDVELQGIRHDTASDPVQATRVRRSRRVRRRRSQG